MKPCRACDQLILDPDEVAPEGEMTALPVDECYDILTDMIIQWQCPRCHLSVLAAPVPYFKAHQQGQA